MSTTRRKCVKNSIKSAEILDGRSRSRSQRDMFMEADHDSVFANVRRLLRVTLINNPTQIALPSNYKFVNSCYCHKWNLYSYIHVSYTCLLFPIFVVYIYHCHIITTCALIAVVYWHYACLCVIINQVLKTFPTSFFWYHLVTTQKQKFRADSFYDPWQKNFLHRCWDGIGELYPTEISY